MSLLRRAPKIETVEEGLTPHNQFNPVIERRPDEDCLATWWNQATPGTSYWRCVVPARHLPGQAITFRTKDLALAEDGETVLYPRQRGDVAIWQFLGDSLRSRVALGLRALHGVRTLMELDDDYTRTPSYIRRKGQARAWADTIEEAGFGYSHEGHRLVAREVDGIICSTEYLADLYSEYNRNVWVCPNSIDPADWQFEREEHDPLRIVYYGSVSHVVDAPIVTKALKWAARQPGVEVWTYGLEYPHWDFAQHVEWQDDLADARKNLFRFDVGVAPLQANPWANGKSDLKVLEYAMAGVLPLMSRVESFRSWFDVAPDLVLRDDDWVNAIKWAVKNPAEVKARAAEVKDHVLANRTIQQSIQLWRDIVDA